MTRAAVYVRISDDPEGTALGVGRQEDDCRTLAEQRGWDVVQVYSDNDVTASGKKVRPGWVALMEQVRQGALDVIVAYSSSRLYRNLRDLTELIELADDGRVQVATVVSGQINLSTADGRMMARILAAVDQGEWERTRERVIRARAEKRRQGEFMGGYRPFGFRVEDKRLAPHEPEAQLIRDAASAYLSGATTGSIARDWNERGVTTTGGKPWTRSHVLMVLTADRNAPEILTPTDLAAVQERQDERRTGRAGDRYLLTGILHCGICDGRMGGRGGRYICTNTGPMHLSALARYVDEHVDREIDRRIQEAAAPAQVTVHDPSEALVQQREALVQQMEALGESDLPDAVIRGRARKLQRQLEALDAELASTRQVNDYVRALTDDPPSLREVVELMVERVTLDPARPGNRFDPMRVRITWR